MGAERRSRITRWRTRAKLPPQAATASCSVGGADACTRFRDPILHREEVEFLGRKPETGGTPTPPGIEFVRYRRSHGLGFRQTAPKTPRMAVRAVSGLDRVGGEHDPDGCHPVGQGPTHGRILKPAPVTARLPAGGPSRDHVGLVVGHDGATLDPRRGSRDGSTSPLAAPVACRKRGVRGGAAPRQSPQGTHGVWPRGVNWLVSHNHGDSRVICMTGSRGRPGLLSARRGERSEPERGSGPGGLGEELADRQRPAPSLGRQDGVSAFSTEKAPRNPVFGRRLRQNQFGDRGQHVGLKNDDGVAVRGESPGTTGKSNAIPVLTLLVDIDFIRHPRVLRLSRRQDDDPFIFDGDTASHPGLSGCQPRSRHSIDLEPNYLRLLGCRDCLDLANVCQVPIQDPPRELKDRCESL